MTTGGAPAGSTGGATGLGATDPDRRIGWSRADLPFLFVGLGAGLAILYLGRSMTFWQDEWALVGRIGDGFELADALRPWNEHWTTLPILLYAATFRVFGLHSYLPYLVELVALHLLVVAGAYVLATRRVGRLAAGLVSLPLLLVGSGSENLYWAFQTGFVGAAAFGTWALVFVEGRGRRWAVLASLALTASVMCSGMGLAFLVAMAGRTLSDEKFRRRLAVLALPVAAYVAWFAFVGRQGLAGRGELAPIVDIMRFVMRGTGHAVGSFSGLSFVPRGEVAAMLLLVIALGVVAWAVIARRGRAPTPALALGSLMAIVAMFTLIGLVRAELASDFATRSRYVYVAAVFITLAVADLLWLPAMTGRWRRVATAGGAVILAVAIVANLVALRGVRDQFQRNADRTRAYVALALDNAGEPWMDPRSVLPGMPPLPDLVAMIGHYGSPLHDVIAASVAREPRPAARDWALVRMVGEGFRTESDSEGGTPIALTAEVADAVASAEGDCVSITDAGPQAVVGFMPPSGAHIGVSASESFDGQVVLGRDQPPSRSIPLHVGPARPTDVVVPDTGDHGTWRILIRVPNASGRIELCGRAP